MDIRINDKLNSANEFTYVLGLFDSPGFRAKSGLQYYITDFKRGFLTLGPNLMYQRVTTDVFFYHPMTFSGRANDLKIDFKQNRIAADALGSVRFNLTKKIYMEFGLGAGIHYTTNKVVESTAHNLKSLLAEAPDLKFEEVSNNSTFGLLTSFNLNISVVIEE
ncbi:hypothetical protein GCM10007940_31250 [Portibacter lacus]|uniref:Uncharacterized protein n=1 Tax=Portibacter lacus TaxID=1099794 RepID=A0AA37WGN1_9BACT|nr:hypothetical protein GCM10007940_31250 [Portibacter lacus]